MVGKGCEFVSKGNGNSVESFDNHKLSHAFNDCDVIFEAPQNNLKFHIFPPSNHDGNHVQTPQKNLFKIFF